MHQKLKKNEIKVLRFEQCKQSAPSQLDATHLHMWDFEQPNPSEPSAGQRLLPIRSQAAGNAEVVVTNTIRRRIHHLAALTVIVQGPVRNTRHCCCCDRDGEPDTSSICFDTLSI